MWGRPLRLLSLATLTMVLFGVLLGIGCSNTQPAASPSPKSSSSAQPAAKEQAAPVQASPSASTAPMKEETVKVGMPPLPYWLPVFLAEDKGYFAEQKLKVEYSISQATSVELMAPVARGDIEVVLNGINAQSFNSFAQGFDVKMVANAQSHAPGYYSTIIMLRKDVYDSGEIRKPEDLKGRSVSFSIQGAQVDYVVRKLLEKAKLTEKDVKASYPVKGTQDYFLQFANKVAEVGAASEPTASQIAREGLAIKWISGAELVPEHDIANMLYSGKFIKEKPDAARRFMLAVLKGQREAAKMGNKWTPEMVTRVAKWTKMQEQDIQTMQVPFIRPDLRMNMQSLNDQQDTWNKLGLVPEKVDLQKFADYTFVDYAMKALSQ